MPEFALVACECAFVIHCSDAGIAALIEASFGPLIAPASVGPAAVGRYRIDRCGPGEAFRLSNGRSAVMLDDADSLLFHLDKNITLALQHRRPDLFFLHGAAVAWQNRVAVLSASPGTGKSTLTLAMLEHGVEYLSDELAPIDLARFAVHPYPRALCLKSSPPPPYVLPPGTLEHGGRFHVPVRALTHAARREGSPLAAFVFLRRDAERFAGLRPITAASAAARLMANALNPLAHPADGLDAAVALSGAAPSFELDLFDLEAAAVAVKAQLSGS